MKPKIVKPKIVIVGCGVVGASIAYELSTQLDAEIHVVDKQKPAQASTGAALGVLMGIISHKVKGRTWRLREASVRRYQSLIDELSGKNQSVPFNRQGIVSLCFDESKLPRWKSLKEKRESQGWPLEIWSVDELKTRCPHIELTHELAEEQNRSLQAAIYSPADGQVHPAQLTQALCAVALERGVTFHTGIEVTHLNVTDTRCVSVQTDRGDLTADWVILSAGLGSAALTNLSTNTSNTSDLSAEHKPTGREPLELIPVLGQAMEIKLPEVLGDRTFQPVINGDDIQFVPLGEGHYWLGATVEFPEENVPLEAEAEGLENLLKGAIRFCPALSQAEIIRTWSGLRPRPVGQPAPVIKPLGNLKNVTLATGHYRNGVLLAPATALQVCEQLHAAL
ncbi:MAG: FAD-dependent oxidoreductase [Cyanobacteria bacterium J06621_11]